MTVTVITSPPPAVTPAEAKAAQVFGPGDADAFVALLLASAQGTIDGPGGWLGRAIGLQTLELSRDGFVCPPGGALINLPCPPVLSVVAVTYDDPAGLAQTLDPSVYTLTAGIVSLRTGQSWPAVRAGAGSVRVRYQAGYADPPPPLKYAIMLMAADLRATAPADGALRREIVEGVGTLEYATTVDGSKLRNDAADRLLAPFKVWRVG